MTALPQQPHLFTIEEYAQLGETEYGYTELEEGRLLMSPSPVAEHNFASGRLLLQLDPQLPDGLEIIQDIDIDLELAAPDKPGFSRRPDLVIVRKGSRKRQKREGGLLKASEVTIAVEIVSPSSRRTDNIVKRGLFADAGIPYYWIIDIDEPISMLVCHQAGQLGYQDSGAMTGVYQVTDPFPLKVDLDKLA